MMSQAQTKLVELRKAGGEASVEIADRPLFLGLA